MKALVIVLLLSLCGCVRSALMPIPPAVVAMRDEWRDAEARARRATIAVELEIVHQNKMGAEDKLANCATEECRIFWRAVYLRAVEDLSIAQNRAIGIVSYECGAGRYLAGERCYWLSPGGEFPGRKCKGLLKPGLPEIEYWKCVDRIQCEPSVLFAPGRLCSEPANVKAEPK